MSDPTLGPAAARKLAAQIKRGWRKGAPADAAAALAAHPELSRQPSVVLDLAYEEYLLREKAGAAPPAAAFAARFPGFASAVRSVIAAHHHFLDHPEAAGGGDWPDVGATVAGVELVALLGAGGFGRAYLAHDPELDRPCVLKLTAGASAEAKVIARLKHPHVTEVFWARPVDGRTAVCMPLAGVTTLAEVVASAFPPDAPPPNSADAFLTDADRAAEPVVRAGEPYLVGAAAVAGCLADAVAYLHDTGVTHGDIKPANVVVGRGGSPCLIDFNLSTRDAGPAAVRGTPGYMAPELLEAAGAMATGAALARGDLFSLGVMTFELLTGRRPFPAADPKSFAACAAAARAPLPPLPAGLSRAVRRELTACLNPDPGARPESAAGLAAALSGFVTAARTPPAPPPRRAARRVTATALVLVAVLTAGSGATMGPPDKSPKWALPAPPPPPTTADEFYTRGLARVRADDWSGGVDDFTKSNALRQDRRTVAMMAYCYTVGAKHQEGAEFGGWVDTRRDAPPDVLSNRALSLMKTGKSAEAGDALDRAVAGDPALPAARYNRAVCLFGLWRATGAHGGLDPRAVADLRAVFALGYDTAELRFYAARVFAAGSDVDPALRAEALAQVRAGVAAGKPAAAFRNDPTLRERFRRGFGAALAFEAACAAPSGPAPVNQMRLQLAEPRPF
ncbi:protein kinase domain-containing protein [Urbifossiella limnaea]|uniref:Serine/threonine-protein kinase PrkC n=1 Tax=Urbifossiella limnaea TaxID=2528023 RepID=A0A517XLH2_9BACT|nr:serine/threonine-protein kinase [Urbifossiella limnaea]QDU18316.1 Serine/threonine-protein kinase PrkC [Urbifossiella limnaea]